MADTTSAKFEKLANHIVTKLDLEYRLKASADRPDDFQRASELRDKDQDTKIEQIRGRIVPRSEHEEKWRGNDQRFADIQGQLDDHKRIYGETYSLRDAFQSIQKQVEDLRAARSTGR